MLGSSLPRNMIARTLKACDELLGEVAEQIMGGRLRLAGGHAFQWRKYALK
ncbi:BZ3500_MvSof-1268-A1-R1_Chr5-2g07754 [Microbotryum saponariae]|uniref:BZ3500_MvSof-1268-A1-R1_Chr5-2g07754 protein n=1 Tax=Microbotryum saponariae TaxID=289078 RepID=A0A2X0MKM4_9BASI|nr:BZ3500_MvSof-1268-A1-R1_Chr5-2g07754 [Microbotryum saponariae]SDA05623.1 BZ3501_MvSof-1269-A2-R1_Chr5-2g07576 [Microbotryum saponariae]